MTSPTAPRLATIVVCVDDSAESLGALELAATIGGSRESALTIVHVRPTPRAFGLGPEGSIEYAQAQDELDEAITAEATSRLADYPGTWTVVIRTGSIGRELLAVADEVDADLIVVGSKGMQGARRVLGSVPNTISHQADCSVLIIQTG